MIKFFRRIRQQLLSDLPSEASAKGGNKFSKYLLYAIGEIILVVIGIMIALQFNNRNEQQKDLLTIEDTIEALQEELDANFDYATFVLNFWKKQDKYSKKVIFDELTKDDYKNDALLGILPVNWYSFNPKTENLHLLLEYEKLIPKHLKPIISSAKELEKREKSLHQQWNIFRSNISDNLKDLTKQISLVRSDSISKNKQFNYMLTLSLIHI